MTAHSSTPGPWFAGEPLTSSRRVFMPDDTVEIRDTNREIVACLYRENLPHGIDEANARLITAAPNYAVACGLHLHPGENETCEPLSWLRTAIDTLKEDAVRQAASGDDTDAYWHMVNELESLLTGLVNASAKARGEQ